MAEKRKFEDSFNDHITEYLRYYLMLEKSPEFAVLLSGEWGTGKTWFINEFKKTHENYKFLHVSLYGVTTVEEIEDQFYQQLHPVLSSKPFTIGAKIFKGIVKGTLKIDIDGDGREEGSINIQTPEINIPDYLRDTDKCVLIFDDFERCKMPVNNSLGYINHFVERQGQKVIILANDSKISDPTEFGKINEKLVGRKFKIASNFNQALDAFIEELPNKEVAGVLTQNRQSIVSIFNRNDCNNLRTLRQTILEYARFFELLPVNAKKHPGFQADCINTIFSLYIYTKQGSLENDNLLIIPKERQDYSYKKALKKDKDEDIEKPNSLVVLEKNFGGNFENVFPSLETISFFFSRGTIPEHLLKSSVENSRHFVTEKTPPWVRLWYIYDLSDNDFELFYESVVKDFENKKYTSPGVIKHVCGILIGLSRKKVISKKLKQVRLDILKVLNLMIAESAIEYIEPVGLDHIFRDSFLGLQYTEVRSKEFQEIDSLLEKNQKDMEGTRIKNEAKDFIGLMKTDSKKFMWRLILNNSGETQKFLEVPALSFLDPNEFVQAYLDSPPRNRRDVHHTIRERYKYENVAAKLIDEKKWLGKVDKVLYAKLSSLKQPTRYHAEELIDEIAGVIGNT